MSDIGETPREKLKEILSRTGDALLQDPDRCEGLLKDHCGPHRREISALVGALEERVPLELRSSWQAAMTPEAMRARLVQRLQDNRGLAPDVANWAVDTWSYALGVGLGRRSDRLESEVISGVVPPVPPLVVPIAVPQVMANSAYMREFGSQPPPPTPVPVPVATTGWTTQKKAGAAAAVAALALIGYFATPKSGPKECPASQTLSATGTCVVIPPPPPPPPPIKPPEPKITTSIAVGTFIPVSVAEALNSDSVTVGQYIKGTIKSPILVNGKIVVPAGTSAVLQVKGLDQAGKILGAAKIDLALVELTIGGKKYTVASAETLVKGPSKTANTAKKAGIFGAIGAGVGCGIGHVTGHTGAGCGAGAGAGAATGVAVSAKEKPKPAELKSGAILKFRLDQPVNLLG